MDPKRQRGQRATDRAIERYTRTRVKLRFSKTIHKPIFSDVQTTLKHEDVSMPIQKISPGQDLETELQKNKFPKLTKSVQHVLSAQWSPSITRVLLRDD